VLKKQMKQTDFSPIIIKLLGYPKDSFGKALKRFQDLSSPALA